MVMDCGTALAVPGELVQGVRCSVQGGRWCMWGISCAQLNSGFN